MNLNIRPIFSALLRNRTGALLVAMQIAIALAVLVNAVYIVKQRVDRVGRPTGMDVENIFVVSSSGFATGYDHRATLRDDLAYLRALPGVINAVATTSAPLSGGGNGSYLRPRPDFAGAAFTSPVGDGNYFEIDEHGIETLGVRLIAGRNFRPDEIEPAPLSIQDRSFPPSIIITQAYAQYLFPGENALGKTVYDYLSRPAKIIGIIEHMHGSWPTLDHPDRIYFMPSMAYGPRATYLVRTEPGQLHRVMAQAEQHMGMSNPNRVINYVRPLSSFKADTYMADRNMATFLVAVTALLLAIASLGIFGLATFNVNTRTKQIGTRRAVGARRRDIVAYFMVENWLVTTGGVIVGCILALGVGYWLSRQFEMPRLDLYYLVGGVLALWVIGLLAAWQPARRAATVSPAVATRTV